MAQTIKSITLNEIPTPTPTANPIPLGWFPTFHHRAYIVKAQVLNNMLALIPTIADPNPNVESFRLQLHESISELLKATNGYNTKNKDKRSRTVNSLWILFGQVDRVMNQHNNKTIKLWYAYLLLSTDRSDWRPFYLKCTRMSTTEWALSFSILEPSFAVRTLSTHHSVTVVMELALLVSFVFRNITRELEMRAVQQPPVSVSWELKAIKDMYNAYKHENMHEEAHRAILSTMCNFLLFMLAQAEHNNAPLAFNNKRGTWATLLDPIQNAHWLVIKLHVAARSYAFIDGNNWLICAKISMREKNLRNHELATGVKNPMHSSKWNYFLQNISYSAADLKDILHFTGEWASNDYAIF